MQGRYLESQRDVEAADKPFEFFMNRFRLLEAAPRVEFSQYTGLSEEVIRPQLDEAIAQGYLTECADYWQITEHGKLFLNSLLELFWLSKFVLPDAACTQHPATTLASSQNYLITPLRRNCSVSFPAFISSVDIVNFHQNRDFFTVYF